MADYKLDKAQADAELAAIRNAAEGLRDVINADACFSGGVQDLPTGSRYFEQHLQIQTLMNMLADLLESDVTVMQNIFNEQARHDRAEWQIIVQ